MFEHCEKGDCCIRPDELRNYVRTKDAYGLFTSMKPSSQPRHYSSMPSYMETMGQEKTSQHQAVQFICPLATYPGVFDRFSQLIHHLDGSACGEWVCNSGQEQLDLLKKKYIK